MVSQVCPFSVPIQGNITLKAILLPMALVITEELQE